MDAVIKGKAKAEAEPFKRPSRDEAEDAVRTLIAWAGDDPKREGLVDTPSRVVAMEGLSQTDRACRRPPIASPARPTVDH